MTKPQEQNFMPEDNELSREVYERFVVHLRQMADKTSDWMEESELNELADSVTRWLDGGDPPSSLDKHSALLDEISQEVGQNDEPLQPAPDEDAGEEAPVIERDENATVVTSEKPSEDLAQEHAAPAEESSSTQGNGVEPPHVSGRLASLSQSAPVADSVEGTATLPASNDEGKEPAPEPLTPEQQALNRQLDEARRDLEAGKAGDLDALRQAVARATALEARSFVAAEASQLLSQARDELNRRLAEAQEAGDRARAGGDIETARRHYDAVLKLDPDNSHARRALRDLDQTLTEQLSQEEMRKLRLDLNQQRDLKKLGDAVYHAEALQAEGHLSADMVQLLHEARANYDRLRTQMGEETTMMRMATLELRKEARDKIAERVAKGAEQIYDSTTNTLRDATEVLREAEQRYREGSEETASYEIDRVRRLLPAHPRHALEILNQVLDEQPFHEEHRRRLTDTKDEVEGLLSMQEEAEGLRDQAQALDDPLQSYNLMLQAHEIYPHLPGLQTNIEQIRGSAVQIMAAKMRGQHDVAETLLDDDKFEEARQALSEAAAIPNSWPQSDIPPELQSLLQEGEQLRQEVRRRETIQRDFDRYARQIRSLVQNPDSRKSGLELFNNEVLKDERFDDLTDRRILASELDQYKEVGDQLAEAKIARTNSDWARVSDLAEMMRKDAQSEQLVQEIEALHQEANLELDINRIRDLLERDDVAAGDNILRDLLETRDGEAEASLRKRLQQEIARIEQAKADTPPMLSLFEEARSLAQQGEPEQLQALRIFRYIGGDRTEKPNGDWPPFKLSMRTVAARQQASRLRGQLRETLLPRILEVHDHRHDETQLPSGAQLRRLAELGSGMRQARLLDDERERAAARWLILRQGKADARQKEDIGNWDEAVQLWKELDTHYPGFVNQELRRAQIEQAIMHADRLVRKDKTQEAIDSLHTAQDNPDLAQATDIYLKLVEIYVLRGEFDSAFADLALVQRQTGETTELVEKRQQIVREREIQNALQQAEQQWTAGDPKEALRILKKALEKEPTNDSDRLRQYRDDVAAKAIAEARRLAQEKRQSGGIEDKVEAVVALVDMHELEELSGVPAQEHEATAELEPLRGDIEHAAQSVIDDAHEFDPERRDLDVAIREASDLIGRMQTFVKLFDDDWQMLKQDLKETSHDLSETLDDLRVLRERLNDANDSQKWQDALETGNFNELQQQLDNVLELNFRRMLVVTDLEDRFEEWKMAHDFLEDTIVKVQKKFTGEEDFAGLYKLLRLSSVRPPSPHDVAPQRAEPGRQWRQLQQSDYEVIRRRMSSRLIVQDLFSENRLVGWEEVEAVTAERQAELEAWQAWDRHCEQLMDEAGQAIKQVNSHTENTPHVQRKADWEAVIEAAEAANEALSAGAQDEAGEQVPMRSNKVRELRDEGVRRQGIVTGWLNQARRNLPDETDLQFPSATVFSNAARSVTSLREVIQEAERIGPSTPDQRKRLRTYKNTLKRMEAGDNNRSLFDRIFNR